jgi:hypothetical protein
MEGPTREFAIRLNSIDQLFWEFDSQPIADRAVTGDVRWYLLDEWERVRHAHPSHLTIYTPASEREDTDQDAVRTAIRRTLRSASGPLRRVDPLSRQEKVAAWLGVAVLFVTVGISSALDHLSDGGVVIDSISQAIIVVGWVAVWRPAERFVVEVMPHVFNRRRFAEFADIDIRFVWV